MTAQEMQLSEERVRKYRVLEEVLYDVRRALEKVTEPDPNGPCGQNPFTGNWRESRMVVSMTINFSKTKGGAEAVELQLDDINISAPELGSALEGMLRVKLKELHDAMAAV